MDQFAVAFGSPITPLLLDCRSLEHRPVPIAGRASPRDLRLGAPRALADSAYNARRAECARAVDVLRDWTRPSRPSRDVTPELLEAVATGSAT
jgi:galactokinase